MVSFRMENATGLGVKKFLGSGSVIDGKHDTLDIDQISEHVGHSRYSSPTGLHPGQGQDRFRTPGKGYSWLKGAAV